MGDKDEIILNLGCGYAKIDNCINIDCRKECNPDLLCDIKNLPYEINSIDGIYALDVLEHIPRTLVLPTLKLWYKILKKGKFLILRLPNVRRISDGYLNNKIDCNEFSRLMYGEQEQNNPANFHKSGFDKQTLRELLKSIGFKELKENIKIPCYYYNMLLKFEK